MAHEIERARDRQFVCRNCGSTLTKLPEHSCPICGQPVSRYREVIPEDNGCIYTKKIAAFSPRLPTISEI